jgi:isopentenyl-diphosphate delta-isomerase
MSITRESPQGAETEQVVLLDERGAPVGAAGKLEAHRRGLLHRAFSVFAFSPAGELLLQQRAYGKYHSGGLWSNTCCGHPRPGEVPADAARRRLHEEFGMACGELQPAGTLRYRSAVGGLIENELDQLFVTRVEGTPTPDAAEIAAWRYVPPGELTRWLARRPADFTAWLAPAWRILEPRVTRLSRAA